FYSKVAISMAEMLTLIAFSFVLGISIITNVSILIALFIGLILFISYALYRKFTLRQIGQMIISGIRETKTIIIIFPLIGMLTALWRAGGTIPFIIYHTVPLIDPEFFVMSAFLLCSLVSCLTGTAFGTASTMGIICMMIGKTLGIPAFYLGGAILSGIFFGDRCSPMSSSALLVSELTGTNIYININNMIKTSIVPFIFTVALYAITGHISSGKVSAEDVAVFAQNFNLSPWVLLPALIIIILTLRKVNIKITIICSIIAAAMVCVFLQGMSIFELFSTMMVGYHSNNAELAALIDGGGIISMLKTIAIVAISSSYFGIFRHTKLLDKIKQWSYTLALHSSNFAAVLIVSIITGALSCNQTLATMLTYEITEKHVPDREKLAVYLENSVILTSALIPWSIAATFPITTIGAPINCILYAVYLYAVPIWNLFVSFMNSRISAQRQKFFYLL
ncbi:MAG: hypothetical protein L5655_10265, partial [Thermosediminibacteraceae bacterium]|nr:hypothetical protein [Thermosediminibacteraceae bacterium]